MDLLLDTHALLWWLDGDTRLPAGIRKRLTDPDQTVFVSAASAWEIATKTRIGKLHVAPDIAFQLSLVVRTQGFIPLPISLEHAECAGALPGFHRDPFDRMLIAQTQQEGLTLVSNENIFDRYKIKRIWNKHASERP